MNDMDLYRRQGMGNRIGFGRKAALVLVDIVGLNAPMPSVAAMSTTLYRTASPCSRQHGVTACRSPIQG